MKKLITPMIILITLLLSSFAHANFFDELKKRVEDPTKPFRDFGRSLKDRDAINALNALLTLRDLNPGSPIISALENATGVPFISTLRASFISSRVDFHSLDKPYCSVLHSVRFPANTAGICGSYGLNVLIPQNYQYGDRYVNIEKACEWHDDCFCARWHGGTYTRQQCDHKFYEIIANECRRVVGDCSGAYNHCLDLAKVYQAAVEVGGERAWNTQCRRSTISSSYGPNGMPKFPQIVNLEALSAYGNWVLLQ